MTDNSLPLIDRLAMSVGGGLVVLGVVVLGLVNDIILDAPTMVVEEEGQVVAEPVIDPHLRATIVVLGLLVLLLYGIYRLVGTSEVKGASRATAGERAD